MEDRRSAARTPIVASLEICSVESGERLGKGFIKNIGENGVALETPKSLKPGERYLFCFRLPSADPFDVEGQIVYTKDGILTRSYGARFGEAITRLRQYILSRGKRNGNHRIART